MVKTNPKNKLTFPLIDSLLLLPKEGKKGEIGICTNTIASGQVFNEIDKRYRKNVSVLGSLIVSRDGAERMILNSLAHPTLKYLVLFSEESLTFSPSTNLLQALQYGINKYGSGNQIKKGVAASGQYPNLSKDILDAFGSSVIVLPVFMYKNNYSKKIVFNYLKWLKPQIPKNLYELLIEINNKKKIYFDSLNVLLKELESIPASPKRMTKLNVKDFQHLQPPKIKLHNKIHKFEVPFRIRKADKKIRIDLNIDNKSYNISGEDEFLIAYSLMKFLKAKKKFLSPLHQLLLGAELGRVSTEIANNISFPAFIKINKIVGKSTIPLNPKVNLIMDKKYYYKLGVKNRGISCICMAFDLCEEVFELNSQSATAVIGKLAELNRFEEYGMDILHRIDIGTQIGRAGIAASLGYTFIQDFPTVFKINKSDLPFVIVKGEDFLDVHKGVLRKIYTQGITEEHGDVWKGPARTASVLAVYKNTKKALKTMPKIYQQGESSTKQMRKAYKKELLRFDHDGSYSYGERTRAFFGFDQLENTTKILKKQPSRAAIIQRYNPTTDMGLFVEKETGKTKSTHDPCLTHDLFFIKDQRLHSFHIARAHNAVNAYPENIFGLYDAYTTFIRRKLGIREGDMFMLSNRANILLLTEEQRTKKLLDEPSKPLGEDIDKNTDLYQLGENIKLPGRRGGVAYFHTTLQKERSRPESKILERLECLNGVNTIERAITYLEEKGVMHNNPVLSSYQAGESDPQEDCLVFFQTNVFGEKLHTTAVFANRALSQKERDERLCNYITTRYAKKLNAKLGKLTLLYVAYV